MREKKQNWLNELTDKMKDNRSATVRCILHSLLKLKLKERDPVTVFWQKFPVGALLSP